MAESKEELKSLWIMRVKKSERASFHWLKLNIRLNVKKTKIMTSETITSWQIEGWKSGSSDKFSILGLKNQYGW